MVIGLGCKITYVKEMLKDLFWAKLEKNGALSLKNTTI